MIPTLDAQKNITHNTHKTTVIGIMGVMPELFKYFGNMDQKYTIIPEHDSHKQKFSDLLT